ncbi:MAG: D-glycero-beta-D-manno-heptose 1-phosphate adenylyltransferase [Deltaproteobacteria bacterium]|nr:D-glycero-beta-D-manno-heptose 1-phosphate adenylyltransferase [Deltaproteobacteria bacterium]
MPRAFEEKQIPFNKLSELVTKLRADGKRIVTTNGCFDILHLGHMQYLFEARGLGDILLCGINSDKSVIRLKGSGRPLFPEAVRARQVAALECVDYVTIFEQDTPEALLKIIRPAIHVKGGDYRPEDLPERHCVEGGGGKVVVLPFIPGFSTTGIITKLKGESNP